MAIAVQVFFVKISADLSCLTVCECVCCIERLRLSEMGLQPICYLVMQPSGPNEVVSIPDRSCSNKIYHPNGYR